MGSEVNLTKSGSIGHIEASGLTLPGTVEIGQAGECGGAAYRFPDLAICGRSRKLCPQLN
jgi:hypothetical protein